MSPKRSRWEIYKKQMSQLNHGDALWEPAPLHYFERIRPGDVGYICRGCFNLLFSAGSPLGGRELGVDVPRTFEQLVVGPILNTEPRSPGCLSAGAIREIPTRARASMYPMLEPGTGVSFQLTGGQGAALLTKHSTYSEDVQRGGKFEVYAKTHYDSWVAFARECGHPTDVKPVLVTGVDLTRDFAMMSYSNDGDDLTAEFTIPTSGVPSPWGIWRKPGAVYTNCGPQLRRPPSVIQIVDLEPFGNSDTETVSGVYRQCVFIRYYTVRKRLGIPRVIKAAAGPHDLGPGNPDDQGPPLEARCNSDSGSDTMLTPFDDGGDDDRSSVTSADSEDTVIHNTTADENDDFDTVADYVFQNSNAGSVLIHHQDIALLREPGGSMDFSAQLNEKRPPITVDGDGVGTIGRWDEVAGGARSNDMLGITPPAPSFAHDEAEREATNRMALSGPRPPLLQENPERTRTTVGGDDGGGSSGGLRRNRFNYRSRDGVSLRSRFISDSYRQIPSSPVTISSSQVDPNLSSNLPRDSLSRPLEPNMGQSAVSRKLTGLRRVRDATELRPITTKPRMDRRTGGNDIHLSPIRQFTTHLVDTFHICNPQFRYESTHNPRRVLTIPSDPAQNDGYDNKDYDYILSVNDRLGTDEGHQYLVLDILGRGRSGQVAECQNMETREIVAVKVIKNKPTYFNQSMMEVTILELLNNQYDPNDEHNILRLRDSFIHRSHLCLVFELLSCSLHELIEQNRFQGLSMQLVKGFTIQLLDSLAVLKQARLIHCDLKPQNILLRSLHSPQIKVIDFGSACHERQTVYTYIQSRFYRSPEALLGIPYNASIDMWSLGCIAAELFLGLPLFPGTSECNQVTRIVGMLGMPPQYMMDEGKQANRFFYSYSGPFGPKKYHLKTLAQYSRERNVREQPGKEPFEAPTLRDIINQAPMPKFEASEYGAEVEKELNTRASFIDFCQGLLNLDPLKRWTPEQAKRHPFITGDKFTKPWSPHVQDPTPQPSPQHPITPTVPKQPYGGSVPTKPMKPKKAREFQDKNFYSQYSVRHQVNTARTTARADAFTNRNPYIGQSVGSSKSALSYSKDKTGTGYSHPSPPNLQQYMGFDSYPALHKIPPPPPTMASLYPIQNAIQGAQVTSPGQMYDFDFPLAPGMSGYATQDAMGERNAPKPILERGGGIREWGGQTGEVAAAHPSPQLEYPHQHAELVAPQDFLDWDPWPSGGDHRSGVGGGQLPPTSGLARAYRVPSINSPLVADEDSDGGDVVTSSIGNTARGDEQNTVFNAITNPSLIRRNTTAKRNRHLLSPPSPRQSQTSPGISDLRVSMRPDMVIGYQSPSTQSQG